MKTLKHNKINKQLISKKLGKPSGLIFKNLLNEQALRVRCPDFNSSILVFDRFYCWNIEAVDEACRSPWLMWPWSTMRSVLACVKMTGTDLRHVLAATGITWDIKNEPLPLLQSSVCHPLPLGANKILPLSCCPFLIGWSRTDWNLINLPNGFDCCGIPIVCSVCILERQKFTGADLDYYLYALKTSSFSSSEIRTLRHLCLFFLRSFLKFSQRGLIVSWKMGASLFKYFLISKSELAPAALLPLLFCYYHQDRERYFFHEQFSLPPSCFAADLICGEMQQCIADTDH